MQTWIHFIGKQYYTEKSFQVEGREYGVTRRISPQTAKQMAYGDRVLLAINDGKSAVLFGSFIVQTLSGMGEEAKAALANECTLTMVSAGGKMVSRGCGSYIEGPTWALGCPISMEEIVALATEAGGDNKFMVGGDLEALDRVRMKSMRFAQGFRPFNYGKFLMRYGEAKAKAGAKLPSVPGQFYTVDVEITDEEKAVAAKVSTKLLERRLFQQVSGYAKK